MTSASLSSTPEFVKTVVHIPKGVKEYAREVA